MDSSWREDRKDMAPHGQSHDRLAHDGVAALGEPVEISALQKMLSATSGSLLTGLLGMSSRIGCEVLGGEGMLTPPTHHQLRPSMLCEYDGSPRVFPSR